jgi:hypothetical protein
MKESGQFPITPAVPLQVVLADKIQEGGTYPSALPFGHHDEPRGPVGICGKEWADGEMRNRLAIDRGDKIFRRRRMG